ncbi:uncharacterized protein LOC125671798 isoform X1 [Ostrea edulis]|uniref:uncharacterized protein LOC125671798 isoform X1 n=1 Tax=Ostrea edulis TaxID=37623 RepID=UPI0024AEDAB4|nr:uncharacterized protein LOC125671798 isoform X1 [Ostrea edulis]
MAQGIVCLSLVILGCCYLLSSHLIQNPFTSEQLAVLANANFRDLPFRLQVALRRRPKTGDNSHFCCSTDTSTPIGYKTVSKVVSEIIKVGKVVQVGENSCGFLNTGKCHQNELRYEEKVITHLTYEEMPLIQQCPSSNIVCCNHYVNITGNCMCMCLTRINCSVSLLFYIPFRISLLK